MHPAKNVIALLTVRCLAWRNGLEGFTSLAAFLWGLSVLSLPAYWREPCAGSMHLWLITPRLLGPVLIATGAVGFVSLGRSWRYLRRWTSVVAFMVWGLMAVWSYQVPAIPVVDDVAIYSAFAAAELAIYVRILAGLDPTGEVKAAQMLMAGSHREDETPTRSIDDAGDH
jgi:hypothetical protein